MKTRTCVALSVVLFVGRLTSAGEGKAIRTVKDLAGREVSVPAKVERIVALGPGALRLVAYLRAVDKIVGIEDMEKRMDRGVYQRPYAAALPESFLALPVVGPGGPGKLPDYERLMLSRPDAIVAVAIDPAAVRNIEGKTGIPTVFLSYGELGAWGKDVQESLLILGKILDREARAGDVNAYIRRQEEDLRRRTKEISAEGRSSAYFGGISFKGAQAITSTQAGYVPADLANVRNVADSTGKRGHFLVEKEQIMAWNPDVIFVDMGSRAILDQDFMKNAEFYRLLRATGAGRVFSLLPYNYYNTNIEIALLNAYFVGKCQYPETFGDVEMAAKAKEIIGELLGIEAKDEIPAYGKVTFPKVGPVQWGADSNRTSNTEREEKKNIREIR